MENMVRETVGKIWTLPNTVIGLIVGLAEVPFGARMHLGDNGIEFTGYPWGRSEGGAITIGNVILFHNAVPDDLAPRYDGAGTVRMGTHERAHTYQAELLGPLFGPAYLLAPGAFTLRSPYESAADNFADASGSWWPWKHWQ